MTTEPADDLTDEERALFGAYDVAGDLALRCRQIRDMNVAVSPIALDHIVSCLMTEFLDRGFSQAEIEKALDSAVAEMNRYAAGEEPRP